MLLDAGFVTICAGGGGVPVAVEEVAGGRVLRRRHGVEAVIDKVGMPEALAKALRQPASMRADLRPTAHLPGQGDSQGIKGGGLPSDRFRASRPVASCQDAASALLAAEVGAHALLLLTDAPAVFDPRKFPGERAPVPSPTSPEALLELGSFSAGSMGPKLSAPFLLCWF